MKMGVQVWGYKYLFGPFSVLLFIYPEQNCWIVRGFPGDSAGKESASNAGDLCSIPGLGRSPGEGKSCPLQYSGLKNSMDCIVHAVS